MLSNTAVVSARRENILADALRYLKRKKFDPRKKMKVRIGTEEICLYEKNPQRLTSWKNQLSTQGGHQGNSGDC